jgi:hypothetical protein
MKEAKPGSKGDSKGAGSARIWFMINQMWDVASGEGILLMCWLVDRNGMRRCPAPTPCKSRFSCQATTVKGDWKIDCFVGHPLHKLCRPW